jgi:phosphoglycolate phosphatase
MPGGPRLNGFEAVLFDVDGTLVDSLETLVRGLGDTYEAFNGSRPKDEDLRAIIGLPLSRQMAMFRETPPSDSQTAEMAEFAIERFRVHSDMETAIRPAVAALEHCHRHGLKTALVTSKSAIELAEFLEKFPLAPFVRATVCSSDVAHPKPAADSALLACDRLGVPAPNAIMIGDSIFDLRCARAAGVGAVGVAYGATPYATLQAEQPDALFRTPDQLRQWIEATVN